MIQTSSRYVQALLAAMFLLGVSQTTSAQQLDIQWSSLHRYQVYVVPWLDSQGTRKGLEIHYSIGAVQDVGGPPLYSAACYKSINTETGACVDPSARVWVRTASYPVGTWVVHTVPLDCANTYVGWVQVLQPYTRHTSTLNFAPWGQSPYQGGRIFYGGTADTASIQTIGCQAALR